MKSAKDIMTLTGLYDYKDNFCNALKNNIQAAENLKNALGGDSSMYLPKESEERFRKTLADNGVVRRLSTNLKVYGGNSTIWAYESEDCAQFVGEGDLIPSVNVADDFTKIQVKGHKIAGLAKVTTEFVYDAAFDVEAYVSKRMARSFAVAEDRAFINGTGIGEPAGLLHATKGAEVAETVSALTYDDCLDLFFSVDPKYRKNSVWIMNDHTALALRKLKDDDGNYIWNQMRDTILGRPVVISNEMPDLEVGKKPILFGDLSYYWVIDRFPISITPLYERFANNGQVGYIVRERLDGKLVRSDAVKVIAIGSEGNDGE